MDGNQCVIEPDLEFEAALQDFSKDRECFEYVREAVGVVVTFNFLSGPMVGEEEIGMLGLRMIWSHFVRDQFFDFVKFMRVAGCEHLTAERARRII